MGAALAAMLAEKAAETGQQIAGMGMGLLLEKHNDKRQLRQQGKLNDLSYRQFQNMTDYANMKQLEMWEKTNYGAQMEQLKKAGLNPGLIYGMGGGGGATTGSGGAGGAGAAAAPSGGGEVVAMGAMGIQRRLAEAQVKVMESQANLNNTEAQNKGTGGVVNENIKADTQNKVLEGVVKDYLGREAKEQYEIVKQPNREIEAQTYQTELEARTGIAGTIYELWTEGKLKEKSVAEIEEILLKNNQSRAETKRIYKTMDLLEENIKGAYLDNIIRELETKLQTQTGIDRNAPTWLKVLGRLFVQLTTR